ncbi:MAG: hypothetical protein HOQ09_04585 [Gemmatimonadaceae bacterium]|nr:hypothetical protein [Gemmatimonadaceae bacterium]
MRSHIATAALLVASACKGPPARLAVGASDTVVVNNEWPVQLAVHVFDARGHALPDTGVRYEWLSGRLTQVSPTGVATCDRPGDAVVRASLGSLVADLKLLCRPIRDLRVTVGMQLVAGDSAEPLPFEAVDAGGRPVTLLAGTAKIMDSSVATLEGLRVRPRSPGRTAVGLRVGSRFKWIGVTVYEKVPTLEVVRPERPNVAVSVTLASGETRRLPLPRGRYLVGILPDSSGVRLAVLGAGCVRISFDRRLMCDSPGDATVVLYTPWSATPTPDVSGAVAVQRIADSDEPAPPRPTPTPISNPGAP